MILQVHGSPETRSQSVDCARSNAVTKLIFRDDEPLVSNAKLIITVA